MTENLGTTFRADWEKYIQECIHEKASPEQIESTRHAFYSGACCVLALVTRESCLNIRDELIEFLAAESSETIPA